MELKEKLFAFRREQGLTQDELAQKVGVTRQAVSKWERGVIVPSTVNLIALSRVYGVPLDELANGDLPSEGAAPAVAVAEKPEEAEGRGKAGPLKIVKAAALAACILLVTVASAITIWSAVFKELEEPTDNIVWIDDLIGEDIDSGEIINLPDGMTAIEKE